MSSTAGESNLPNSAPQSIVAELAQQGIVLPAGRVRVDGYGDSEKLSQALLALILTGRKRAGSGLVWAYEHDGEDLPNARHLQHFRSAGGRTTDPGVNWQRELPRRSDAMRHRALDQSQLWAG